MKLDPGLVIASLMIAGLGACSAQAPSARPAASEPEVDAVFSEFDRPGSPGCALGVMRGGELIYGRGYGLADLERKVPIGVDSVFRVGSVSKQFTAMTTLLLAERGDLELEDDIRQWLPEMPDFGDTIRVSHLIHHTSGLRDYLVLTRLAGYRDLDYYDAPELLSLLTRQRDLNFRPGTEFLYSNSGYFLLGQIVERASGRPLRAAAHELIFEPLGMASTHFHDDPTEMVPDRALGYAPGDGGYVISMTNLPITGDGAVFTTVNDLLAWDRNFYDNRLGKGDPDLISRWLRRGKLESGEEIPYGSGIMNLEYRGLPLVAHGGAFVGFRADMIRFPQQRFGVVTLCNLATADPSSLSRRVADIYLGESMTAVADGPARATADAAVPGDEFALPVAELRRYTGRYRSAELGVIYELEVVDGRLQWSIPLRLTAELRPVGDGAFAAGSDWNRVGFRFAPDSRGRITGLMVDAGRVVNLWFDRID